VSNEMKVLLCMVISLHLPGRTEQEQDEGLKLKTVTMTMSHSLLYWPAAHEYQEADL